MTFRSPKEHHKCASVQKICQSKGNGPFYKNCFIDLLTTVHFFSVLTAFATYFGVIQRDSERIQRIFFFFNSLVGTADRIRSTVYKPEWFTVVFTSTWETLWFTRVVVVVFFFSRWRSLLACSPPPCRHGDQTYSRKIDKIQKRGAEWVQ